MGYIRHHAIIVTGWLEEAVTEARDKAVDIFNSKATEDNIAGSSIISPIVPYLINSGCSFFIGPDGSKEGWSASTNGDEAREEFLNWLRDNDKIHCDYVELRFGGDDDDDKIERSQNIDMYNKYK